jgi:hypothetical protein
MAADYLFVVARERLELYAYLKRTFAGDERIQVTLDQRVDTSSESRATADRRAAPNVATNLPVFGFAIIRLRY